MLKCEERKGFTLIELIIAIAILAVLLAVFAPLLFSHVEESRMQSDESEMSEVVNAVHLAITDSNVFDEAYKYSIPNNYITSVLAAAPNTVVKLHCPHGTYTSKAAYTAAHQSVGHSGGNSN